MWIPNYWTKPCNLCPLCKKPCCCFYERGSRPQGVGPYLNCLCSRRWVKTSSVTRIQRLAIFSVESGNNPRVAGISPRWTSLPMMTHMWAGRRGKRREEDGNEIKKNIMVGQRRGVFLWFNGFRGRNRLYLNFLCLSSLRFLCLSIGQTSEKLALICTKNSSRSAPGIIRIGLGTFSLFPLFLLYFERFCSHSNFLKRSDSGVSHTKQRGEY